MSRLFFIVLSLVVTQTCVAGENVESLINKLVEISKPGYGYSPTFSGTEFLPYANTGQESTFLLGGFKPVRSETLRKIVEQGVDAVPALIKHIGDDRKIKMTSVQGISVTEFTDQYDFNRRTRKEIPREVNRDWFDDNKDHPDRHSLTVGDLCFVALGQIVNRRYAAVRYVPSGIVAVSSPTYSRRLRENLIQDWKGLTRKQHIQLLVQDFEKPDDGRRMYDAYLRLSYYYPEVVSPLVIKDLEQPTYDGEKVSTFVEEKLYKVQDKNQRQKLFTDFIRTNGKPYEIGIMSYLYSDVADLEEIYADHNSTRTEAKSYELLVQLFGRKPPVKFADRPRMPAMSVGERASFISSLTFDKNQQVNDAIRRIFLADPKEKTIAPACLLALAKRGGNANFLVDQLNQFDFTTLERTKFQLDCLMSISASREKAVQNRLLEIALNTPNDGYFVIALFGVQKKYPQSVFEHACQILDRLPDSAEYDWGILKMIGEHFPDRVKVVYPKYLSTGSLEHARVMCELLSVLNLSLNVTSEILCPLLDDQRDLDGWIVPVRVCDLAAITICEKTDQFTYDFDWSLKHKNEVIAKIKKHCTTPEK